jgi:hypothetical protein
MMTETDEKPEVQEGPGKAPLPELPHAPRGADKFCPSCRVPLGPYAMNLPLEGVEAQGWMYRRMAYPRTWKEYLVALMLFGPPFLFCTWSLIAAADSTYTWAIGLPFTLLFLAILARTTWNFAKRPLALGGTPPKNHRKTRTRQGKAAWRWTDRDQHGPILTLFPIPHHPFPIPRTYRPP